MEDVREEIRLEARIREQQGRPRAASTEICIEEIREEIKRVAQAGNEEAAMAWICSEPSTVIPE